jgi:hypothetical protein
MRSSLQICLCAVLLALSAARSTPAQAQDQSQSGPIPAYSDQATPYQSLAGVQGLSLGIESNRSYWQPQANISVTADSNPQQADQGPNWIEWVSASAGTDIHRVSGKSNLTLSYTAGGMYTNQYASGNGIVQALSVAEKLSLRRTVFSFIDQASYLPESGLGFSGLGTAALTTGTTAGSGLAFNPGPTILTGNAKILNNSDAVEMDQLLTPRSSLTFSGGYSLLHYFDASTSLFDYGVVNARVGYNYQMTTSDTFAVLYTFGDYQYSSSSESLVAHTAQISYGRVITGKLAFQVAAGPQIVISNSTPSSSGTSGGGGTTGSGALVSTENVLWSLNSSLRYQERRYGLDVSYNHGVSGGSGLLLGGETDTVNGSLSRQMSRTFSSGFTVGYSRVTGLPGAGLAADQSYHYWFGGLNLTEPLGQSIAVSAAYQVQYQTANAAACVGVTCGQNILRHTISVTFGWRERPLLF